MVITLEQKRKRQQLFVVLFVVILFTTAVILYFTFLKSGWNPPPSTPASKPYEAQESPAVELSRIDQLVLDRTIINDLKSPNFESFGILPIQVGELGRENPFLPY